MKINKYRTESYRARNGDRYSNVSVSNFGNGIFRVDRPTHDFEARNVTAIDGYRVFETLPARDQNDASITKLVLDTMTAWELQRGFARIGHNSRGGVINKIEASGIIFNEEIPCGIAFMDSAHDFTISNCIMRNFRMELGAENYWNGDGYSSERKNYGLRFLNCSAFDCTDGGFDLKSTGTFLDGCVADGNKFNYRFWSPVQAWALTSLNPRLGGGTGGYGHFSITGSPGMEITIEKLVAQSDNTAPLFTIHDGAARVIISSHDIQLPPETPLIAGRGQLELIWKSGAPAIFSKFGRYSQPA